MPSSATVGHHGLHEVVPGQRIERGQRLIQDQQVGSPGQGHGERELRLLAAGQLADLLLQRDAELGQPGLRPPLVPAPVQVAGDVQHVGDRQVLVQRRVLGHEGDPVQGVRRPGGRAAQHGHHSGRRQGQADGHVQQGGLARAVRADQGDTCPAGNSSVQSRSAQARR